MWIDVLYPKQMIKWKIGHPDPGECFQQHKFSDHKRWNAKTQQVQKCNKTTHYKRSLADS